MQFKLTLVLLLLPTAFALPESISEPIPEVKPAFKGPHDVAISPRDESCSYTTGCVSKSGASSGTYCGFCTQVRGTYNPKNIYQVNGGSGSSSCCDFGVNNDCATHWPSVSPNVYVNCAKNNRGY